MFCGVYQIVSIIEQPIIGILSDKFPFPRFKRRAFILTGTIIAAISLLLLGHSHLIFPENIHEEGNDGINTSGAVLGFICALVAFIAYGFIQIPSRTIIIDVVEPKYHPQANFMATMTFGFMLVLLYIFAGIFAEKERFYQIMYIVAVCVMSCGTVLTLLSAHENRRKTHPVKDEEKERKQIIEDSTSSDDIEGDSVSLLNPHEVSHKKSACSKCKNAFSIITKKMWLLYFLNFISMIGFGGFGMNISTFYASNIYKAETTDPLYNKGISMGMFAMSIMCGSQCIFSLLLPSIKQYSNHIMCASYFFTAIGYAIYIIIDNFTTGGEPETYILIASYIPLIFVGLEGCCVYSVPYSVIRRLTTPNHYGVAISLVTASTQFGICIAGWILSAFIQMFDSLVVVMWIGAILSVITFVLSIPILFYINPKEKN